MRKFNPMTLLGMLGICFFGLMFFLECGQAMWAGQLRLVDASVHAPDSGRNQRIILNSMSDRIFSRSSLRTEP